MVLGVEVVPVGVVPEGVPPGVVPPEEGVDGTLGEVTAGAAVSTSFVLRREVSLQPRVSRSSRVVRIGASGGREFTTADYGSCQAR